MSAWFIIFCLQTPTSLPDHELTSPNAIVFNILEEVKSNASQASPEKFLINPFSIVMPLKLITEPTRTVRANFSTGLIENFQSIRRYGSCSSDLKGNLPHFDCSISLSNVSISLNASVEGDTGIIEAHQITVESRVTSTLHLDVTIKTRQRARSVKFMPNGWNRIVLSTRVTSGTLNLTGPKQQEFLNLVEQILKERLLTFLENTLVSGFSRVLRERF